MKEHDIYYLRSILGHLREFRELVGKNYEFSLGSEVLSDNIDWLDCFVDRWEKQIAATRKRREAR